MVQPMPSNLVKPGQEKYWKRAKAQAAKQGHEGDYAYITSIFKQMTLNKSFHIEKSFGIPKKTPTSGDGMRLSPELQASVSKMPEGWSEARFFEKQIVKARDIVSGLGLSNAQEEILTHFVRGEVNSASNVLELRKALMQKFIAERYPPEMRQVIASRAAQFYLAKSGETMQQIFTPDELLEKAQSHGGSYYRRVQTSNGKYRYFYNKDDYEKHSGAHVDGGEQRSKFMKGSVYDGICKAGKDGCDASTFKGLAKRFGSQAVYEAAKALKEEGKIIYKGSKFYKNEAPESPEAKTPEKKPKDAKKKLEKGRFHIVVGRGLS